MSGYLKLDKSLGTSGSTAGFDSFTLAKAESEKLTITKGRNQTFLKRLISKISSNTKLLSKFRK